VKQRRQLSSKPAALILEILQNVFFFDGWLHKIPKKSGAKTIKEATAEFETYRPCSRVDPPPSPHPPTHTHTPPPAFDAAPAAASFTPISPRRDF
jgi:hypothetical protein